MPRTFAPRAFLRHTANSLLARYFHARDLLAELDIEGLKETDVEPIFETYQTLPDDVRTQVDSDFTKVDRLAHAQGEQTLLDEARFQGADLTDDFAAVQGFHDRAMLTFLDHPAVFNIAAFFNDADLLPKRYWLRSRGVPHLAPGDDDATCHQFAGALGAYLRQTEGRGQPCTVEVYLRVNRHYYFAYPEDYGETHMEYVGDNLQRRPLRSAFEIIFVYSKGDGTLDIFFDGSRRRIPDLREIFSREILGRDFSALDDERIFDLNRLKKRTFRFVYPPESGIVDVKTKRLRLSPIGGSKERVTLDADPLSRRDAVYDLLDRTFQTERETTTSQCSKLPLSLVNVTQAGFTVEFRKTGGRGRPTRSFDISYPNACPLGHEGRDAVIRQMLIDSGIERAPVEKPAA